MINTLAACVTRQAVSQDWSVRYLRFIEAVQIGKVQRSAVVLRSISKVDKEKLFIQQLVKPTINKGAKQ